MFKPHILTIETLEGAEWRDNDAIMLHACFKLLTDCVENEKLLTGHVDWSQRPEAKAEIEFLYHWWQERAAQEAREEIDAIWTQGQHELDSAMLIRLIHVRKFLWT